ncbi:hypothetical protein B0X71_15505 [Planococcus lenghuensis]|uniref:Uncharacterized protein n=1 Tax=Planococcus lenghuensis TaxID=2213202 RepID=A0A1Q2L2S4_9BACL|nr:hypothetical protein B0X71_15505 [Planococcus lenghuensis]
MPVIRPANQFNQHLKEGIQKALQFIISAELFETALAAQTLGRPVFARTNQPDHTESGKRTICSPSRFFLVFFQMDCGRSGSVRFCNPGRGIKKLCQHVG